MMLRLSALLLIACAAPAADEIASVSKDGVEIHVLRDGDTQAHVEATNRNTWPAVAKVGVAFSVGGDDTWSSSLTLLPSATVVTERFALDGSAVMAQARVRSVACAPIGPDTGFVRLASCTRDGVTVTAWTWPGGDGRALLEFDNPTSRDVQVSYCWNLDRQTRTATRRVPKHGRLGQRGEVVETIRAPDDDRETTRKALTIEAVVPVR